METPRGAVPPSRALAKGAAAAWGDDAGRSGRRRPRLLGPEITLMSVKSQDAAGEGGRPAKGALRRLSSRELLAEAQEVIIVHEGEEYRLRCTSKGKLILTK